MSNEPHDLNQQENDEFIDHVCSTLKSKGFDVDVNVGIGGYSIDLAIRKNGKYMLGIECDGNLYTTSPSTRDRDYHRRKYLQARGWKMYRIWSSNWWRNPDHEVERISKLVSSDR
jgi:very-short-patch-repair endonuclease